MYYRPRLDVQGFTADIGAIGRAQKKKKQKKKNATARQQYPAEAGPPP